MLSKRESIEDEDFATTRDINNKGLKYWLRTIFDSSLSAALFLDCVK